MTPRQQAIVDAYREHQSIKKVVRLLHACPRTICAVLDELAPEIVRHKGRVAVDLVGKHIGHWTVLEAGEIVGRRRQWFCRCDCGVERWIPANELRPERRTCRCVGKPRGRPAESTTESAERYPWREITPWPAGLHFEDARVGREPMRRPRMPETQSGMGCGTAMCSETV